MTGPAHECRISLTTGLGAVEFHPPRCLGVRKERLWQRCGAWEAERGLQVDPVQLLPQGNALTQAWQSWQQAPGPVQPQRQLSVHSTMLVTMDRLLLWLS